jgi:hypothetical protein
MEMRPIFILIGLLAATAVVAEAYRWVDEDGVVNYSDRRQPGAEPVELRDDLPTATSYQTRTAGQAATNQNDQSSAQAGPVRYESLAVASPGAEVTLWDIGGLLNVSLALTPGLQSSHQVRVYLDGGPAQLVSGTNFQLEEVYRGVHNIQAEVIDQSGRVIIRSQPNRFYVQQNVIRR